MLKRMFMLLLLSVFVLTFKTADICADDNADSDLTQKLMEVSGVEKSTRLLPQLIIYQIVEGSKAPKLPISKDDMISVINKSVDIPEILKSYYEYLDSSLTDEEKNTLIDWYSSDPGKKIVERELKSFEAEEQKKKDEFAKDIRNLQVSPARSELLQKYDDTIKLTEELSNIVSNAREELTQKPLTSSDKREISNETYIEMLLNFKELSDEELSTYINFLATDTGGKITRLTLDYEKKRTLGIMKKIQKGIAGVMTGESGEFKFKDLNFRFKAPGKPWVKLDIKSVNPDATLYLQKAATGINITIVAEKFDTPVEFSVETLVKKSKASFKTRAENIKFYKDKKYSVNGIDGIRYSMSAVINKQKTYITVWAFEKNGYLAQVIFTGPEKTKRTVKRDFKNLISGFELIDCNRIAYADSIKYLETYSSDHFGYSLKLKPKTWLLWTDLDEDVPEAETGGSRDEAYFSIFSVYHGEDEPDKRAVLSALPRFMNIEDDDHDISNIKPFNDNGLTGYTFDFKRAYQNTTFLYKIKIMVKPGFAYMAAIWAPDDFSELDTYSKELFDGISFNDVDGKDFNTDSIAPRLKAAHAEFTNSMGLYFYKGDRFDAALKYFRTALGLNPENKTYLKNTLNSYSSLSRYSDALAFLETKIAGFEDSLEIKSWEAWLLNKTDKKEESIALFKDIFKKGFREDEDFIMYVSTLSEYKRWDEAEEAFIDYMKGDVSLAVDVEYARLKRAQGLYDEAVSLMKERQKNIPFNARIAFELIRNYMENQSYKDVIDTADELIKNDMYPYDAYYYRGEAEYYLKWYREAKESLEKAYEITSNDDSLKNFIMHISGLLGEGNNTNVKREIKPVELPAELNSKDAPSLPDDAGYGSCYIHRIKGVSYDGEKEQKTTTWERIKIVDSSGVLNNSTIDINFNPLYEDIYVNRMAVENEKGEVVSEVSASDFYIVDNRETSEANHEKTLNIPVLQLKPGYIIDLVYTVKKYSDSFNYFQTTFSKEKPVLYSAVFFKGNTGAVRYRTAGSPLSAEIDGGLAWYIYNPPVYRWEPRMVHFEKFLPAITIAAEGQEWTEIGADYLEQIKDKMKLTREIKDYAGKLIHGLDKDEDILRAIINDVQSNFTYKAIEFGRRASMPNSCDVTIKNRYGDCKDHALLLHMLLKAVSIESNLALVNNGGSKVKDDLPDMDQFNHMIVYLPGFKGGIFVDPTDKRIDALKNIPSNLGGRQALILAPENIRLETIPEYKKGINGLNIIRTVSVSDSTEITVDETVALTGNFAGFMREVFIYMDKASYKQWIQSLYAEYFSSADVDSFEIENLSTNAEDMILKIKYHFPGESENKNTRTLKVPNVWEEYYLENEPVDERKTDFEILYPFFIKSSLALNLPAGSSVSAGEDSTMNSEYGRSEAVFNKEKADRIFDFYCDIDSGSFKKEKYSDYTDYFKKVIDQAGPEVVINLNF